MLIPADAQSVERLQVNGGQQVSYQVQRAYPAGGIEQGGIHQLRLQGWKYCAPLQEKWTTFLDARGDKPSRIYQRLSYLRKGARLITIGERYYSGPTEAERPKGDMQVVTIVDARYSDEQIAALLRPDRTPCE